MSEIAEDVMKAAREHIEAIRDAVIDEYHEVKVAVPPETLLAKAILAERERCAKIAAAHQRAKTTLSGPGAATLTAKSIGYSIRSGESP
jgi:hypothetical protein